MSALQEYHGRRFVIEGSLAVLRHSACFNQHIRQAVDNLEKVIKENNWKEYQVARYGPNTALHKPLPKRRRTALDEYLDSPAP